VFNYYFDTDRDGHEDTVRLFEAIGAGEFEGYASVHVTDELKRTQEPKRGKMLALVENYGIEILKDDTRSDVLAELYIKNEVIPATYYLDSLHVAMASVNNLDCIVSYNFAHINRAKTKILTIRLNKEAGYNGIAICTSKEVLDNGV
jgi:hypothetical protein